METKIFWLLGAEFLCYCCPVSKQYGEWRQDIFSLEFYFIDHCRPCNVYFIWLFCQQKPKTIKIVTKLLRKTAQACHSSIVKVRKKQAAHTHINFCDSIKTKARSVSEWEICECEPHLKWKQMFFSALKRNDKRRDMCNMFEWKKTWFENVV